MDPPTSTVWFPLAPSLAYGRRLVLQDVVICNTTTTLCYLCVYLILVYEHRPLQSWMMCRTLAKTLEPFTRCMCICLMWSHHLSALLLLYICACKCWYSLINETSSVSGVLSSISANYSRWVFSAATQTLPVSTMLSDKYSNYARVNVTWNIWLLWCWR